MQKESLVSIIVLNYNAGELLLNCINSLKKSTYTNLEIIVVDNISSDGSQKKCKEKFPEIKLIQNNENLGYCEGNNIGIREAKGEFIVILNPDAIVDSNWLDELILGYETFGDGIYQPKFLTIDNTKIIQSTGNMIQLFGFGYSRNKGDFDDGQSNKPEIINYASGTCLFTTKKIFQKLELFDAFLFAYHDDLDLCWRASLQGINSYYIPKSIVYHPIEGFSFKWSNFKFYLLERNRQYCLLTHYSRKTFFKILPSLIIIDLAVSIFYLKNGIFIQKCKATLNIIKNLGKINRRYKEIQDQRKISDKDIIESFKDEIILPKGVDLEDKFPFNKALQILSRFSRLVI